MYRVLITKRPGIGGGRVSIPVDRYSSAEDLADAESLKTECFKVEIVDANDEVVRRYIGDRVLEEEFCTNQELWKS